MMRRASGDRGATMIVLGICATALLGLAGLALDGGRAYGERREMQNAADSAAMAATRQLDELIQGNTADASTVRDAALDKAEDNGAERSKVTCQLVRFDRSLIEDCPATPTLSASTMAIAAGVRVTTENTEETIFMKVLGNDSFTAAADATAQIGRPGGRFIAPFLVCATAPGHVPPILVPDPSSSTGFVVNDGTKGHGPTAVGNIYDIYGNDIKDDGKDCGNPSSSFRGNVCADKNKCAAPSYSIPGEWDADTGNANGPTLRLVNSGSACHPDYTVGCVLVLPLCPNGNGQTGAGFQMHCTDLGLFQVDKVENHDIEARFLGAASLNTGGIVGPADPNGARIVALTD